MVQLADQLDLLAHAAHRAGELTHRPAHLLALQIRQNVVAVVHGLDVAQRTMEERRQLVLVASRGHPGHDLIEIEVGEELQLGRGFDIQAVLEQDALKRRHRSERLGGRRDGGMGTALEFISFHRCRVR